MKSKNVNRKLPKESPMPISEMLERKGKMMQDMYYRIKNQLDAEALASDIPCENQMLADRISELAEMLDSHYSGRRSARDMGGYILFFPTAEGYDNQIEKILRYYHLDFSLSEYKEVIGEKAIGGIEWFEEMWLLSSDDALVMIHPVAKRNSY